MSKQYRTLNQLKDSQIMFEKQLPPFGYMLLWAVAFLMVGIVCWSTHAPKAYMIMAQGTVTSSESNYVMSSFTGEITDCVMHEGQLVEEGDTLFKIKSTEYNVQQEQLEESRTAYEKQVAQYELLVQSIKDDTNYFDPASTEDTLYYSTYEAYKSQIAQNELDTDTYKAYGYTDEQIKAELEKNQGKISEVYYTALQSAENAIQEANTQIAAIDAQLSAINSGKSEYEWMFFRQMWVFRCVQCLNFQ